MAIPGWMRSARNPERVRAHGEYYGITPEWMTMPEEEIERHISLVKDVARRMEVYLRWENIRIGASERDIIDAAREKEKYIYQPGDYIPRYAAVTYGKGERLQLRAYKGRFYWTINDMVVCARLNGTATIDPRSSADGKWWFLSASDAERYRPEDI